MGEIDEVTSGTDMHARLDRLLDREEINQVLIRSCRGLDEHDLPLFLDQFDEAFSYSYNDFVVTSREKLGKVIQKNWQEVTKTTHLAGNVLINFVPQADGTEDRAEVTSDCLALTVRNTGEMGLVTAAYTDRLVKRNGTWRLAERVIKARGPYPLGKTS